MLSVAALLFGHNSKAQDDFTYRLDSAGSSTSRMTVWEYYPDGKTQSTTFFHSEEWLLPEAPDERREYIYYPSGELERNTRSYWNEESEEWELSSRFEFTYDESGNQTSYIQRNYDSELMDWDETPAYADLRTYNDDGQLLLTEIKSNIIGIGYLTTITIENTYDEEGLIEEELLSLYGFGTDSISSQVRETYSYMTNGNVEILKDTRLGDSGSFEPLEFIEEIYESDQLIERLISVFSDGEYNLSRRETPIYNPAGIRVGEISERFIDETWVLESGYIPTFDDMGNIIEEEYLSFNEETMIAEPNSSSWKEYNSSILMEECLAPFDYSDPQVSPINRIETDYIVTYSEGNPTDTLEFTYYYTDLTLSTEDSPVSLNFALYPNPANDQIKIDSEMIHGDLNIKIISTNGSLVASEKIRKNEPLDISVLSRGMYFCQIESNGYREVKKLMVR